MQTLVYCRTESKGRQTFYLSHGGRTFYLFTQNYRVSVKEFFRRGFSLCGGYDYSGSSSSAVHRTIDKIRSMIPYIERENGISILKRTGKRGRRMRGTPHVTRGRFREENEAL